MQAYCSSPLINSKHSKNNIMRFSATKSLTYNPVILTGTGLNFMVYTHPPLPLSMKSMAYVQHNPWCTSNILIIIIELTQTLGMLHHLQLKVF